ncbi:Nodal modulator 1 [Ophiophagus hannah]|uniref:Nodal modulator 1 n=1 Tax=Ophiophagus hannah TaxID=8665 RepID=V8NG27_OPHHA|nr:Nodal modulator 1 [Ophiophagus hannah]
MIPLYDKGDFVLKIEPPLGWSFGQALGPAGVLVALRSPSTGVTLQSTTTQPGGNSNAYASSPLIVAGYNVSGSVRSDGEPMKGVMFLLFSSSVAKEDIMGCNSSPVDGFPARDDSLAYLCNVISKEDGTFTFQGERITFDVAPSKLDFVVEHDSLKIEPVFHVMGFSVTGRILNSPEGEGVPDATVILNSQIKDHLFFDTMTVKIAPNTPQLADIIVTEFSVCGQISVTRFPDSIKQITKYKVNMWPQEKEKAVLLTTETDARGAFCFKARPGLYVLQVIVPDAEVRAGLALKPKVFPVTVASKPVLDVIFSQFLASVSGKITCLDACGELMVILQSILRPGEKRSLQLTAKSTSLAFTFENVLPGQYKMSIIQEDWCWKNKSLEIEVVEEDVLGIEFRQTGVYEVTPRSCHRFEHEYYTYDTSAPSILTLTAIRHHVLGTITTDKLMDVMVTIRSSIDSEPDLVLGPLKSQQELRQEQQRAEIEARRQEREKKGPAEEGSKPPVQEVVEELLGPFHYDFSYWARSGEKITVTPSSKELLFYPPSIETVIKSEDGHPLAGVLLSLSGGTFRSNLLTQDNGMLTFPNLEGQNLKIAIVGYRTAYSCYGTVSSLNGEPEQGIAVEAVGQGECAIYGEDTVTDEEGRFRLRGLLVSVLKTAELVGSDDVDNVNIVAFRQINQFDLSGNVITPSEYLPTLWVKLYKSENLDNPVHTVSLGQSLFFHFPPLLRDGENYMVLLDSTLSKSQYDYTLPQVSFTTVGYHKHITLVFNPTRKLPEQDIAQGSYIALPLTLLLLLAGYNHDKLIPLLLQLTSRLQGVCALGQAGADTGGLEDIKRQAKKQKMRRTKMGSCELNVEETECMSHPLPLNGRFN